MVDLVNVKNVFGLFLGEEMTMVNISNLTTLISRMLRGLDLTTTWILLDSGLLQSTLIVLTLEPSLP